MPYQYFIWEQEQSILQLTINRPEVMNALDKPALLELEQILSAIETDPSIRVLIITGSGKAFVSGADIKAMLPFSPDEAREFSALGQRVMQKIEQLPIPVIAAVNGFALGGGCELMLCADIRIAVDTARIGLPEISLGIMPGFGGTQRLPRLISPGKAKEFIFTAEAFSASVAYQIGLVEHVCSAEQLLDFARGLARRMIKNSPDSLKAVKESIAASLGRDLDSGFTREKDCFGSCFATENQHIGMQAFVQKEKPQFQDRA
jgi:enoyl-CoA hydratase